MYRASPPRSVSGFAKTAVGAPEVYNTDFDADDFLNLFRSTVRHEGGFAHGEYALMPDMAQYDRLRVIFGVPTLVGTDPDFTLQLWGMGSEEIPQLLGTSELSADGTFPPIEFDNFQSRYYLAVGSVGGTDNPAVTVEALIQGVYEAPYTRG